MSTYKISARYSDGISLKVFTNIDKTKMNTTERNWSLSVIYKRFIEKNIQTHRRYFVLFNERKRTGQREGRVIHPFCWCMRIVVEFLCPVDFPQKSMKSFNELPWEIYKTPII